MNEQNKFLWVTFLVVGFLIGGIFVTTQTLSKEEVEEMLLEKYDKGINKGIDSIRQEFLFDEGAYYAFSDFCTRLGHDGGGYFNPVTWEIQCKTWITTGSRCSSSGCGDIIRSVIAERYNLNEIEIIKKDSQEIEKK